MTDVGVHDRLIVIVGPTASGKSSLALELAGDLGGELVSADSVQVYRGLDIGSAKPSKTVQAATPHHLINVLDPREQSDAAWWAAAADDAISAIRGRGNRPIVVGGTGLYIRALLRGLVKTPTVDTAIRDALETELDALGPQALHARLKLVDPTTATRLAPA
ncbi:MAG: tRNA dimethylallyltransferase, partial [Myxococcota bacterium]